MKRKKAKPSPLKRALLRWARAMDDTDWADYVAMRGKK